MRRLLSIFLSLSLLIGLNTINKNLEENTAAIDPVDTQVEVDDENWSPELDDSNYTDFVEAIFAQDADAIYEALAEKSEIMPEKNSAVELLDNHFFDSTFPTRYAYDVDGEGEYLLLYRQDDNIISVRLFDLSNEENFLDSGSLKTRNYLFEYRFETDEENGRILLAPNMMKTIDVDLPFITTVLLNGEHEIERNEHRDFSQNVSYTIEDLYAGDYTLSVEDTEVFTLPEGEIEIEYSNLDMDPFLNLTISDINRDGIQLLDNVQAEIIEDLNPIFEMIYTELNSYPADRDSIPDNLKELAPSVEGVDDEIVARAYSDIVFSNISANVANFSFAQIDPESFSGLREIAENTYEVNFKADYNYTIVGSETDSNNSMLVQYELVDGELEMIKLVSR